MLYANISPETQIWSDRNETHKAGRVPYGQPLEEINLYNHWWRIERPANLMLGGEPAPLDPNYPNYFVHENDVTSENPIPEPPPEPEPPPPDGGMPDVPITDEEAGAAFVLLMKWISEL